MENLWKIISSVALGFKKVLTFQEALIYSGLSDSQMYKLTSERAIKHYKPNGKIIFFLRMDVDDWILQNPIPTRNDLEQKANQFTIGIK